MIYDLEQYKLNVALEYALNLRGVFVCKFSFSRSVTRDEKKTSNHSAKEKMKSNIISLRGLKFGDCHYSLQRLRFHFFFQLVCVCASNHAHFDIFAFLIHCDTEQFWFLFTWNTNHHPISKNQSWCEKKSTRRPWIRNNLMSIVHVVSFVVAVIESLPAIVTSYTYTFSPV